MEISYASISTAVSNDDVKNATDNLYSSSSTFTAIMDWINTHVGKLNIEIVDNPGKDSATTYYDGEYQIRIPSHLFDNEVYEGTDHTYHPVTLERYIAHEIYHVYELISGLEANEETARAFEDLIMSQAYNEVPTEDATIYTDGAEDGPDIHNTSPAPQEIEPDAGDAPGSSESPLQNLINSIMNLLPLSPLVLDIDHSGTIEISSLGDTGTYFDLNGDGQAELTAWVTGGDGLLARDLNSNGNIDDISELFGTYGGAEDGFASLRALDSDGDGSITGSDDDWGDLVVWVDANMDGRTQGGELHTLDEVGIASISLAAEVQTDLAINGSQVICLGGRAMTHTSI